MAGLDKRTPPKRGRGLRRLHVEPLEHRMLLSAPGWPGTVIHDASGNLFTVDLDGDMALEYVDQTVFEDTVLELYDMAFSPQGELYGVDNQWFGSSRLYTFEIDFDTSTVTTQLRGTISLGVGQGIYVNSLQFNTGGELFAAGEDAIGDTYLFKLDPDTAGAQRVLWLGGYESAGDLTFDIFGNLYLTTLSGDLLRIPPEMDSFEVVGQTEYADFFGLVFGPAPLMYGFREAQEVYRIDPASGEATWVANLVTQPGDPSLGSVNGAATLFPPPTNLGEVDFRLLPNEEPTLGELWYRIEPTREAVLTVDLADVEPGAPINLTLYQFDDQGELRPLPTQDLGEFRVDYEGTVPLAEYFVEIEGAESNVDVRVANLVRPTGNGAMVYGTDENDSFQFAPGPPYTIIINGVNYPYNFSSQSLVTVTFDGGIGHDDAELTGSIYDEVASLSLASSSGSVTRWPHYQVQVFGTPEMRFGGGGGDDSATLIGSGYGDTIVLEPKSASVFGNNSFLGASDVPTITVDAVGGADTATFTGTVEKETARLGYLEAVFSGTGFLTTVVNAESIFALAGGGGDTATFSDSPETDRFDADPTLASLTGPDFSLSASGFEQVRAEATHGGDDVAVLRGDPAGEDTFEATPEYGRLSGDGFTNEAASFRYVYAYGTADSGDTARLYGNPGTPDTFQAWYEQGRLFGQQYDNRARSFRTVLAYANPGDADVAVLRDDPQARDFFKAWPDRARIYNDDYYVQGKSFSEVRAFATPGGADVALLFDDPDGADKFKAWPDQARLYGDGFYNIVKGFDNVRGYATPGHDDVAVLYDDPQGPDTLKAWPDQARIFGNGFAHRAYSFRYLTAVATPGHDDLAIFYDDPSGPDIFQAWPDRARLYGDGYRNQAKAFRHVQAIGSRSGNDRAYLYDSALTDYLEAADNWATLSAADASFAYRAQDFDYVTAISTISDDNIKRVAAVDYVLDFEPEESWQDQSP